MQDVKRLISEVAAQNGIRVEPDDPLFALVTMNKMVLEEATQELQNRIQALISGFDASYQRAEKRAGSVLAQIVKESAEQMRQGLQNDIHRAGLKASEFVHLVNKAHRRPTVIRWSAVGLAAGALLFGAGFWLGALVH
jgi:Transcriptional activator TraM